MPHHIYTTESIILKREAQDTSAYYYILTRNLGLIRARAQGVRQSQSRLKGALQEFSLSTIAYVRGKSGWKITTAIPERNFFADSATPEIRIIIAHIAESLIRFIPGEEVSPDIFSVVEKGFAALIEHAQNAEQIEAIMLVRILHILGYVVSDESTAIMLDDYSDFSSAILSHAVTNKPSFVRAINNGFKQSQL